MTDNQEKIIKNLIRTRDTFNLVHEVAMYNQGLITSSDLIEMLLKCPETEVFIEKQRLKKNDVATIKVDDRVVHTESGNIGIVDQNNGFEIALTLDNRNIYHCMASECTIIDYVLSADPVVKKNQESKKKKDITVETMNGDTLQVSFGNHYKDGCARFNLPSVITCPGSTKFCRKNCHASKAERVYLHVLPPRNLNLRAVNASLLDFKKAMSFILDDLLQNAYFNNKFLIHGSGDFFSQEYFDAWLDIVRLYPRIRFLAFTKTQTLCCDNLPTNLKLYLSIMPDTDHFAPSHPSIAKLPRAYAGIIPEGVEATQCPGYCDSCEYCYERMVGNVYFNLH